MNKSACTRSPPSTYNSAISTHLRNLNASLSVRTPLSKSMPASTSAARVQCSSLAYRVAKSSRSALTCSSKDTKRGCIRPKITSAMVLCTSDSNDGSCLLISVIISLEIANGTCSEMQCSTKVSSSAFVVPIASFSSRAHSRTTSRAMTRYPSTRTV